MSFIVRLIAGSLGIVVLAGAAVYAAIVPVEVYKHPQRLISIDGRHINLYCVGKGKPTVLLDSGSGDTMLSWTLVQLQIAEFTRVCSYDRAGYGFSDPPRGQSDANAVVADIHGLIHSSDMDVPIIYVGHSIAGLYGLLLEAKHPDDVGGEVLVDPSFVGQFAPAGIAVAKKALATMRSCLASAQKGELVHPKTKTAQDCVDVGSVPDPTLREVLVALQADSKDIRTGISEFSNFAPPSVGHLSNDERELEQVKISFGDKPLTVLTRSKFYDPDATAEQLAAQRKRWTAGHDRIAALSERGKNVLVPNSNHEIQIAQPTVVVSAVRSVVTELRQEK
jgi:pimeloyl-ACP methyl ester carboxylesterase